jgi:TnpA family transposase
MAVRNAELERAERAITTRHRAVPADANPAADCDVRLDLIESVWDELVRVTASIQSGHCSAVQALTRFGAAARGQPVYDGGFSRAAISHYLPDRLLYQSGVPRRVATRAQ